MKNKKLIYLSALVMIGTWIFNSCSPLREFGKMPAYEGPSTFYDKKPAYDSLKKTVIIVADNEGTELFDMMAPYYLFNTTGKANVYIVAPNKFPIVVKKGFFLLPQFSFAEIDSLKIRPDVMVIPYLSSGDSIHQKPEIIHWIKNHFSDSTRLMAVCDGAATAAATGLFDGKPITAHASDYAGIKIHFSKPLWTNNTSVAHSGNLFSTAGVSNAVEGSLLVIKDMFGEEVMKQVEENILYPYPFPKTAHQSLTFTSGNKLTVAKKIFFRKNKKLGILLQDRINEFELAAVMDTYNRSFPKSIESFTENNAGIQTKYGLTIFPTGNINNSVLDELHLIGRNELSKTGAPFFKSAEIVTYDPKEKQYIIDRCLQRIKLEYGSKFEYIVKLMLDYH